MTMTESALTDQTAAPTSAHVPTVALDLSLLIEGGLSGKVLDASKAVEPYATALADLFGNRIRSGAQAVSIGYPVDLPVEVYERAADQATGAPKQLERTEMAEWLNENVPLGDPSFRWAITPNGRADRIIVKIVKRRNQRTV